MAEAIDRTNGVPSLQENTFPALESAPEKIVEDVPSVLPNDDTHENPKELSTAEKLMLQHALAAQKDEAVTKAETKPEEPKFSELVAAPVSEKKAGKQKESTRAAPTLDVSSAEAFPSLGGPAKAVAPVTLRNWGRKMATPPASDNSEINSKVLPFAALGSGGQQRVELSPAQKRPMGELRKPAVEIVKEIMKKTGTKIDMAQTMTKTTVFIITGDDFGRQRARMEIFRELSLKVFSRCYAFI
jgi:hypothetical protein